jgi:hypothetical protein
MVLEQPPSSGTGAKPTRRRVASSPPCPPPGAAPPRPRPTLRLGRHGDRHTIAARPGPPGSSWSRSPHVRSSRVPSRSLSARRTDRPHPPGIRTPPPRGHPRQHPGSPHRVGQSIRLSAPPSLSWRTTSCRAAASRGGTRVGTPSVRARRTPCC